MPAAASHAKQAAHLAWRRSRCTLSFSGGGAARGLAACARRAARLVIGSCMCSVHCSTQGHCTHDLLLSYDARPCFDAPAAASNAKHALRLAWRRRHCAISLSRKEDQHARFRRARAALRGVLFGPCFIQGHFTSERPLFFGARPCSDVLAAASNAKHALRLAWRKRHCALSLSLSGGGAARALARHANRCNALYKATAPARGLFRSVHGRALTCQPLFITSSRLVRVRTRDWPTALALCGKEAQKALAPRVRRAALVRVGLCRIKGHCTSEIYYLPRCETVLRRASIGYQRAPGLCVCAHAIAPLHSPIWGRGTAHALAARSRRAAPVGVAPCTVRGHCSSERPPSYGARPCANVPTATSNAKQAPRLAWRRRHCALSLSREEAQHACLPRAREALRGLWSL